MIQLLCRDFITDLDKMASGNWYDSAIKGVLLDITGVLYNSTDEGGVPIPGSIDAVKR